MEEKQYLMLPGPTYVPSRVLRAMSAPLVNHRDDAFYEVFARVTAGLRQIFRTEGDVLVFPSAGTGAMEAAIANLFSPGDQVLVTNMGAFGRRFADIGRAFGLNVKELRAEPGDVVTPEAVARRLAADREGAIRGLVLTHNETSTGATLDLEGVARAAAGHPALRVVDAVSSLGAIPLDMDGWGLDVVLAGSQKALMTPPGLSLVAVSQRAWQAIDRSRQPRFYWDLRAARHGAARNQTPYTPAVSLWFALDEALQIIAGEGLEQVIRRHALLRDMVRAALPGLGLTPLASDDVASATVTAVRLPPGLDPRRFRRHLAGRYGVTVAGGQGKLEQEIIRIGHVGRVQPMDMVATVAALEMALADHDVPVRLGWGVAAAQAVWRERWRTE